MSEKYPHGALVRAWLDGKTLQYLDGEVWVDIPNADVADKLPHLYRSSTGYRIKPVTVRYRVALLARDNGEHYTLSVDSLQQERELSDRNYFVRWLTDWTEVLA